MMFHFRSSHRHLVLDCLSLRTYIEMGTHFIVISAPYASTTDTRNLQEDSTPTLTKISTASKHHDKTERPTPPYLIRNCLLIPIYVNPVDDPNLRLIIPPLTEIPMAQHRSKHAKELNTVQSEQMLQFTVDQTHRLIPHPAIEQTLLGHECGDGSYTKNLESQSGPPTYSLSRFRDSQLSPLTDVAPAVIRTQWAILNLSLSEFSTNPVNEPPPVIVELREDEIGCTDVSSSLSEDVEFQSSSIDEIDGHTDRTHLIQPNDDELNDDKLEDDKLNSSQISNTDDTTNSKNTIDHVNFSTGTNFSSGVMHSRSTTAAPLVQHLLRYVCRIATTSIGATNIITVDGSYVLSPPLIFGNSSLFRTPDLKTSNFNAIGFKSSPQHMSSHVTSPDLPDVMYRSPLSHFTFPLSPSIRIRPLFSVGGLQISTIRQMIRDRLFSSRSIPRWIRGLEVSLHLRQVVISLVRSINSLETLESHVLQIPLDISTSNIPRPNKATRPTPPPQPNFETSASRVRHFMESESMAVTSLSNGSEIRRLGLAPLEIVITQLTLWTHEIQLDGEYVVTVNK